MLQRFTESFTYDLNSIQKLALNESITMLEDSKGTPYKYIAAYRVPVSRFDYKNANGRVYTKKLWENVIKNQKENWEGSIGLADHPGDEEDASVKNAYCVWKNLGLNENTCLVEADIFFIGHYGKVANEILEAGGKIGFSSSGFGELAEDSSTVREDTYMLERVSDWVLSPSQGVFGSLDMKINNEGKVSVKETIEVKENNVMNESTNSVGEKMSKAELRKFREDVVAWSSRAESITDLQSKLEELTEILSYFSPDVAPDLKEAVEKQIKETKDKINLAIKEHSRIREDFGVETAEQLKEGVKNLAIDTTLYERDSEEWKLIAKGLQEKVQKLQAVISTLPTADAYKTALAYSKKIKEENARKETDLIAIIEDLKSEVTKKALIEKSMIKELKDYTAKLTEAQELTEKYRVYTEGLKNKIKAYREEKATARKVIKEKAEAAVRIDYTPKKNTTKFEGFNESEKVEDYYEDLVARHGDEIVKYEENIKGCKTLQEAMRFYNRIMVKIDEKATRKIPEALDMEDRQHLIESNSGRKVAKTSRFASRLPNEWV
jgi:hypothetical protein